MGHNATDNPKERPRRTLIYGIIVFELILITSLISGIKLSQKSQERIQLLKETKAELEKEHARLIEQVAYVSSDYYVEQVAREELQRSREGETIVILPEEQLVKTESNQIKQREEVQLANWQKWWALLVE